MLRWAGLDPRGFERAVQGLLRSQNPGMVPIDGSGGDGGADSMWRTADGRIVYEMKSYAPRMTRAHRRKVAKSLATAVKTVKDMTTWVLIVPINPTRDELAWFEEELQSVAPGVTLEWRGVAWLDLEAAANPAFVRLVEGPHSQVLEAAAELRLEEAVVTNGVEDLFTRTKRLRDRMDQVSLHWRVDWAVEGAVTTATIRAKHRDAPMVDPIRLTPRFSFDPKSKTALEAQVKLEATMNYGGNVELSDKYFQGFDIEASDEARILLGRMYEPGELHIRTDVVTFDRPIRATIQISRDASALIEHDVWFRRGTSGQRGFRIHGEDAVGATKVDIEVPHRERECDTNGAMFNISFESPWEFAPRDIVPALRLHTAMRDGGDLSITIPGFVVATTVVSGQLDGPDYAPLLRVAEVVTRLGKGLGMDLRMPNGATLHEVELAEAAASALEGEQVDSSFSSITAHIVPGRVKEFVAQLPGETFAAHTVNPDYTIVIGDLDVPYGPLALWMPEVELSNRRALQRRPNGQKSMAIFRAVGQPIYIRTREDTLTFVEDAVSEADPVESTAS